MNISYKHPPALAKAALNHALRAVGLGSYSTSTINSGYGEKYLLPDGTAMIVYYKKGMSSTIISEKMPDDLAMLILGELNNYLSATSTKIAPLTAVASQKSGFSRIERSIPSLDCHIGSDESGKGDYFGGISIAAVYVTRSQESELALAGVRDSKALTDDKILSLASTISEIIGSSSISSLCLTPGEYNEYYPRYKSNVNFLLARAHCKLIEDLLSRHDCNNIIIDQFCSEELIRSNLGTIGSKANLLLTPRAERDMAVAAASIIARANYVKQMDNLSLSAGFKLSKGASSAVIQDARRIVSSLGSDALQDYVKMHFRTTKNL